MNLTHLSGNNSKFLERLYQEYLKNPNSVDKKWAQMFSEIEKGEGESKTSNVAKAGSVNSDVNWLINEYRSNGHFIANLNPLKPSNNYIPHNISDTAAIVELNGELKLDRSSVDQVIQIMHKAHCQTIGLEFMHIRNAEEKEWLQSKLENHDWRGDLTRERKIRILQDLIELETFENYLHVKFPGAKRFSSEGAESALAGLEMIIERSSDLGAEEVLVGMAHRGRLNTLTKVLRKKYAAMLYEFQGNIALPEVYNVSGDVKYHFGHSCDRIMQNGKKIHLSLAANPSHLEAVNSVVMGKVRCKQDLLQSRDKALGVLIHGDAAFTGQGVVHECFNLNSVENYNTGGVIHILINNQIGFTTNPCDARGFHYPAYAGVAYEIPIFHLNGDDPEAVVYCSKLAAEYRFKFNKDVIVGMQCYRKYGHNEGDEPKFTQPSMYDLISKHKTPMQIYSEKLISEGVISKNEVEEMIAKFKSHLDEEFMQSKNYVPDSNQYYNNLWAGFTKPEVGTPFTTVNGVNEDYLESLMSKVCDLPEDAKAHPKVSKIFAARQESVVKGESIDWGCAEHLAFASLLDKGFNVRLAGQDCERGTFSHRHSVIINQETEAKYIPLNHLHKKQGRFEVINSTLSEYAAMGFEYGYSITDPKNLVLWEGQFGDFANGAQIIIDQFIAAAETKWLQSSGLVLLLPHGYEGQGPEHSSARVERFLQLCAEDNMQVVNCTTPANYFHILRRQIYNKFRKPLVIFTPKSLLRHKHALSTLRELNEQNHFQPVLGDVNVNPDAVKKVVMCTGKIYYDLLSHRREDIAVLRIEQLYPFPEKELKEELAKYTNANFVWCQEEPKNMGAWSFVQQVFHESFEKKVEYIGRKRSASTACGYLSVHNKEQQDIIAQVLG